MNGYNSEIERIKTLLQTKELPGLKQQLKMAPATRLAEIKKAQSSIEHTSSTTIIPKKSAVLVLLYPKNNKIHTVLMVRPSDNSVHSGQISFPGGKVEKSDLSLSHTALREAHEEVGVIPNTVELIGSLTKLYIPPSNFDVYPIVGVTHDTPKFITNQEVYKLLEVDLNTLLSKDTLGYKKITHRDGNEFMVPCFHIQDEIVWGATAMILSEFMDVIQGVG